MARTTDQLLIKGGTVVTPHEVMESGCVLIEKGKIAAMGPEATLGPIEEAQVIDARGMIITPGFIDPAMVRLLVQAKGVERVVLVTDAVRAAGAPDGLYDLGGQEITVHEGVAQTREGSFAGSTLTMDRAVRNLMETDNLPLPQALQMATYNPARAIGVDDRKGTLAPGKDADILLLDDSLTVALTMVKGRVVYQAKERAAL